MIETTPFSGLFAEIEMGADDKNESLAKTSISIRLSSSTFAELSNAVISGASKSESTD